MIPKPLAKQAVRAALELQRRVLSQVPNHNVVGLRLPGESELCFATLFRDTDHSGGLILYRGPQAFSELCDDGSDVEDSHCDDPTHDHRSEGPRCETWSILIDRPGSVPPHLRTITALAGYSAREVPLFLVLPPGLPPREPYNGELRRMIAASRALVQAHEEGTLETLRLPEFGSARVPTLSIHGKGKDLQLSASHETFEIEPPPWLDEMPRLDAEWHASLRPVESGSGSHANRGVLAIADATSGSVISLVPCGGEDPADLAAEQLLNVCRGDNPADVHGLPQKLVCADRELFDAVAPMLQHCGVECALESGLEVLPGLEERLLHLGSTPDPDAVPEPGDAYGWSAVSNSLEERVIARKEWMPHTQTARTRFFGEQVDPEDFDHPLAPPAYEEWYLLHHRGKEGRHSLAERMLEEPLPEPERMLLQARLDARIGLWQVETIDKDGADLSERSSGERVRLSGKAPRSTLVPGDCVPGSVAVLQGRTFLLFLGPPIPELLVDAAVQYLRDLGLAPAPESLAAAPHLLGRLWPWLDSLTAPDVTPDRAHVAVAGIADPDAVAEALDLRPELEPTDEDGCWMWLEEGGAELEASGMLVLTGRRLYADLTSEEQLLRLQQWLAPVPGVTFARTEREAPSNGSETGA